MLLCHISCTFTAKSNRYLAQPREKYPGDVTGNPSPPKARIFDPFFTIKESTRGTGLGLPLSHAIAEDHDGQLTFETDPGAGTSFHLDLPVA